MEGVVHDGFALGGVEEAGAEADEAAGGDGEFHVGQVALDVHLDEFAAAVADGLHDGAFELFRVRR